MKYEYVIKSDAGFDDFHRAAQLLEKKFVFISKVEGFDTYYWDFIVFEKQ